MSNSFEALFHARHHRSLGATSVHQTKVRRSDELSRLTGRRTTRPLLLGGPAELARHRYKIAYCTIEERPSERTNGRLDGSSSSGAGKMTNSIHLICQLLDAD